MIMVLVTLVGLAFGKVDPQHVHLSLSSDPTELNVMWWTEEDAETCVQWGTSSSNLNYEEDTGTSGTKAVTYGTGFMHHAKIRSLHPSVVYYYRVGDKTNSWWSEEFYFRAPPKRDDNTEVNFVAMGDMGVFPTSMKVMQSLKERKSSLDVVLHVGDLAYAFGNWTKWNTWFTRAQSVAAYIPYMVCAGNRDEPQVIQERFSMPTDSYDDDDNDDIVGNKIYNTDPPLEPVPQSQLKTSLQQNFYYSFDYNMVHVAAINTKEELTVGSNQWRWLDNDLRIAQKKIQKGKIKWIILMGHTPMYSSSDGHEGGNKILKESMEELLLKYNVSLALWGDDHVYERTYPVYKDVPDTTVVVKNNEQTFVNPSKPIHLLVGTGGIKLDGWKTAQPAWSAYRELSNGYVKITCNSIECRVRFIELNTNSPSDTFKIVRVESNLSGFVLMLFCIPIIGIMVFLVRRRSFMSPINKRYLRAS